MRKTWPNQTLDQMTSSAMSRILRPKGFGRPTRHRSARRSAKMKSLAFHRYPAALIAIVVSLAMGSCSRKPEELSGSAVVLDEVLNAAQNNPLNLNDKIFRLVDIDGRSIERERPSPWEDARPGALVDPGDHLFKVSVAPVVRPAGYVPEVTTFAATVQVNRLYVISSPPFLSS